jgi:hypothetical protein
MMQKPLITMNEREKRFQVLSCQGLLRRYDLCTIRGDQIIVAKRDSSK